MMVALPLTILAQRVVIFDATIDVVPYVCVSGGVAQRLRQYTQKPKRSRWGQLIVETFFFHKHATSYRVPPLRRDTTNASANRKTGWSMELSHPWREIAVGHPWASRPRRLDVSLGAGLRRGLRKQPSLVC